MRTLTSLKKKQELLCGYQATLSKKHISDMYNVCLTVTLIFITMSTLQYLAVIPCSGPICTVTTPSLEFFPIRLCACGM